MKNCKKRGTFDFLNPRFASLYQTSSNSLRRKILIDHRTLKKRSGELGPCHLICIRRSWEARVQGPKVEYEYPITSIMQSQKMCTFFVKQIGHKVHMQQGSWQVANCLFSYKYKL